MRINLPVTDKEYILDDADTVVSKTDLRGNITYVNQTFVDISGYAEEELIGAPQNIVRHPDMPAEAFADFWSTIKSGNAWTGMVKNRCKNGDFYWVEANAAPMLENGEVVGYTSVRVKPSRAQVAAAEQAYRDLRNPGTKIKVRDGAIVRVTWFERAKAMAALPLRSKITFASGALLLLYPITMLFAAGAGQGLTGPAILACCLGMAGSAAAGLLIYRAAVMPLEGLRRDIEKMSAGDLTGRITALGNDELARLVQSLRVLQTNVKLLVGQIKESADAVNSGAAVIVAGNNDLSNRTESQASSLEETASTMEELTSTVKQNASNAHEANRLAAHAAATAVKGGEAVSQVVDTMASINTSSRRIGDITSVIDSIAFQTNILALNAAVEAARAGEQGLGFGVVAMEVRNLAHRSAGAAKEIKALIDDSALNVQAGIALVVHAGKTMDDIVSSVKQVATYMGDISAASQEQSQGIEQVNQAIAQMDEVTQKNAALVEQASASAKRMQDQACSLAHAVDAFKLVAGRSNAPPTLSLGRQRRLATVRNQGAPDNAKLDA